MTRRRLRLRPWCVGATALVTALAGCSSAHDTGASGTAITAVSSASATNPESAASASSSQKTPVRILVTGTFSSPSLSYPQIPEGAVDAANAINSAGGIDGHPIQLDVCNDGGDANTAAQCIERGIREHVVAITGAAGNFTAAAWPVLDKAEVPWIGTSEISKDQLVNAMSFPLDGGSPASFRGVGEYLAEHGDKRVTTVYVDVAQAQYERIFFQQGIEAGGGQQVASVPYALGAPDFTSVATEVASKHPDAVVCACAPQDTAKLIRSLRQAGFSGPFGGASGSFVVDDLDAIGQDAGDIIAATGVRGPGDGGAALAEMNAEVAKSNAKQKDELFMLAWLSVHVVANALRSAPKLDNQSLLAALNTKTNLPTYGVVNEINFTAKTDPTTPRIFNPGQFLYKWKDGGFEPIASSS